MTVESIISESDQTLQDQLNHVVLLRLFCNTNQELSKYIGYKLSSNNSIKRVSPFMARGIFRELCWKTQEQLPDSLALEELLVEYEKTSSFFKEHIKENSSLLQEDSICELLKYVYIADYQLPAEKKDLHKPGAEIIEQNLHMPILLLLMLKILPSYTSRKGDVKDPVGDFHRVYQFLRRFIAANSMFDELPVLERFEKQVSDGTYCNRLFLIYVTSIALNTFSCYMNPQELYALNASVNEVRIMLNVDEAIWVEPEMLSTPSVFWRFERLATNDYFLYRYALNTEKKELVYIRYEVSFINDSREQLTLFVDTPASILPIIENKTFPDDVWAIFACKLDSWEMPHSIELRSLLPNGANFPAKKLIRLTEKNKEEQLMRCLDGAYAIKNKFPELDYTLLLYPLAITRDCIYIKDEERSEDDAPVYYCIPKALNEGLEDITVKDAVGVLTINGRKYINFVPLMLCLEVTDEAKCQESGVLITIEIKI